MQACGQPWGVSSLAQAAGLAALEETAYVEKVRALIAEQRPRLTAGLRALGLRVLDGRANYLLFQARRRWEKPCGKGALCCAAVRTTPGLALAGTALPCAPGLKRTALKLLAEVLE